MDGEIGRESLSRSFIVWEWRDEGRVGDAVGYTTFAHEIFLCEAIVYICVMTFWVLMYICS